MNIQQIRKGKEMECAKNDVGKIKYSGNSKMSYIKGMQGKGGGTCQQHQRCSLT